jgi:hypothetical protein
VQFILVNLMIIDDLKELTLLSMSSIKLGILKENDKWKYFKITLLSFEITGIHMNNMYKSVEK